MPQQQPGSSGSGGGTLALPPRRAAASGQPRLRAASRGPLRPAAGRSPGRPGSSSSSVSAAPPTKEAAATEQAPAAGAPAAEAAAQQPEAPAATWLGLDRELVGKLCLLTVALLWGSYNPLLKVLYSQDGPPGAVAIMLFRGVLQSGVLVACYSLYSSRSISSASPQEQQQQQQLAAEQEQLAQQQRVQAVEAAVSGGGFSLVPAWVRRATAKLPLTAVAATELGTWLFLATGIQTAGLQLTTATRAGFLIQATALITPLLASLAGDKPSRNVWAGCIIALAGCLLIASDESALDPDDAAAAFSLGGDVAILASAFFFSLATVRLGKYARRIPSVELAAAKSVVLGTAAVATFGVAAGALLAAGEPLTDLWPGWTNPVSWSIMVWSALGPGAAAAFLHAKGQSVVPPADAQVIFSTVPLWSIAFAFLLLGGEPLTGYTVAGGAAVVAAGLIASRKDEPQGVEAGKDA